MKIAVWRTDHEIADTVANAICDGLSDHILISTRNLTESDIKYYDIHIGYGILRGMTEVYRAAKAAGKPWICLDRGYWKPGHYNGYYRVSLNGTQQTTGLANLQPDYDRWDALGLEMLPYLERNGNALICTPTKPVANFFMNLGAGEDFQLSVCEASAFGSKPIIYRPKECDRPLQEDLDKCSKVITFNSSVGWEALRQGIPVISDQVHSFVGAYQKQVDNMSQLTIDSRHRMFAVMAGLQLTLAEIKKGKLWPLLQKLIQSSSDGTTGKQ